VADGRAVCRSAGKRALATFALLNKDPTVRPARPRLRLGVETLEDRSVPAVWNNPWAEPGNLTISFAPDGTSIDGRPSALYQEMGPAVSSWQQEILRAFQTWAAQVNINVSVVPDDGSAFGSEGPIQGDGRHGDIRIGARSLGTSELAIATPFDLFGTWSGELIFNTDKAFNLGGIGGAYDVFTVALHEAGHGFGLPHSAYSSSVMYDRYTVPRTGLSSSDVTNIKALYGTREADRFEGLLGNSSLLTASNMTFIGDVLQLVGLDGTLGLAPYVVAGDLTKNTDVDIYRVVALNASQFTVSLRTEGISSLQAKVTLMNSLGQTIASKVATDPFNGDLTLTASSILPIGTYYIKVEKAANDVFAIGEYRLAVGNGAEQATHDPIIAGLIKDDRHTNDTLATATPLGVQLPSSDLRWDFTLRARVSDASDVDYYSVRTLSSSPGNLVVAVWGMNLGGVDPLVTVFDSNYRPVAATVLTSDGIAWTLQVRNASPSSTYYIRVASDPATGTRLGDYFFGADFRSSAIDTQRLSSHTLTQTAKQSVATMSVYQSQLFHFVLATTTANAQVQSAVRLSVRDSNGREVYTLFAEAGQTVSGDVVLAPGTYTLVFTAGTLDPTAILPDLSFTLDGIIRSDPMGAGSYDTSSSPSGGSSSPPPSTSSSSTYNGPYSNPYRPA
jgi:predicted Zn-dependent protease